MQNAANSAAGQAVIQLAEVYGYRTLSVVRRPDLVEKLKALGGDAVVTDDCDLRENVEALCGGARPRLGFNAVGGASALNIANALAEEGTLVTYGAMARQPLKIPNGLLIFRNLTFRGFWLLKWKRRAQDRLPEIYSELAGYVADGRLKMAVQSIHPISDLFAALDEAAGEARSGKVILDLLA